MANSVPLRLYTEISLAVALAVVLHLLSMALPIPRLPMGGEVSLRMLPILLVAWRWGGRAGVGGGALYGLIDFLLRPLYVHPVQLLLDYPLAFGAVGLAGICARVGPGAGGRVWLLVAVLMGYGGRLFFHFISGLVFFAQYAPAGQSAWQYSLLYNGSYLALEAGLLIVLGQASLGRLPLVRQTRS
ncbi:MAG: energy-coupled thiamine transporter ThiT [Candidatus Latescibacteria bacterium]|nr:energy-coupled thiamine transporter ThiT [Candidatus Latescibacterota bacterium]